MNQERVIDLSIHAPTTPHEVWDAIATGPGISSWFVPTEIDGRVGGDVRIHFDAFGDATARVIEWDPPNRLAYRTVDESGGGLTNEWTVEPTETDLSTVRLRVSGFTEDQDEDFEGLSGGWPIFLGNLRLHLAHFRGAEARSITPTVFLPGGHDEAWANLCDSLGIPVDLSPAAHLATTGEGVPMLSGTVEDTIFIPNKVSAYILLMDAPAEGTAFIAAEGDGEQVGCSVWLYLYDVDSDEVDDRWTPYLTERWPGA